MRATSLGQRSRHGDRHRHGGHRPRHRVGLDGWLALALILLAPCSGVRAAEVDPRADPGGSREGREHHDEISRSLEPLVSGLLSAAVHSRLKTAFPLALSRVAKRPECAALFGRLGAEGEATLRTTTYRAASTALERAAVRSNSAAFTVVGSPQTVLARGFARLSSSWAARILIHEALHFAGQAENPPSVEAPTSPEINAMVARACGL